MLRPCASVEFVLDCSNRAEGTVGGNCLWWKSVSTAKGIQQLTVIRTLLCV